MVDWLKSGAVCKEVESRGSSSGCFSPLPVWDGHWDRKMKRRAPLKKHRSRKRGQDDEAEGKLHPLPRSLP